MTRLLWVLAEISAGVLLAGLLAAIVIPNVNRGGGDSGPALAAVLTIVSVITCVVAGERYRKRRNAPRASP